MQLRDYQERGYNDIDIAWAQGYNNVLYVLPCRGGKCMGKGTPILMYDGTIKKIEEVVIGDQLIGPDSLPKTVLSTCTGVEEMFTVTPTKGDSYTVNRSHILSLRKMGDYGPKAPKGAIVNISVNDYIETSKNFKNVNRGWRAAVEWSNAGPLPVDPYFMGLWLGDGSHETTKICTGDNEIKNWLHDYAKSVDMSISVKANSRNSEMIMLTGKINNGHGKFRNQLLVRMRELNVIRDKHIPHIYKTASRDDRLQLLAGLIDTDGYLHHNGYAFTLKSERLVDDIIFIARSLGFSAYKSQVSKKCHNTDVTGQYYSFAIHGDVDAIPALLPRKKANARSIKKDVLSVGITVTSVGEGEYFGFELDGDGLYLLGDFTVTHNTAIVSKLILNNTGGTVVIAHRSELVSQMSRTLARNGVRHRIIGSKTTVRECVELHMRTFAQNFVDMNSRCAVASVDTLIKLDPHDPLLLSVTLWVTDEAHHLLKDNKWGKAVAMMPYARGLGVTATPSRADGKGLGRHADGVFDVMILGPTMGELLGWSFISDYRIFAPPSDIDLSSVGITASGDFSPDPLRKAIHKSHVIGDVVAHYLKIAPGALGMTFCVDVESATTTAAAFRQAGVPSEVISADTPPATRFNLIQKHQRGEIKQLTNVDLFGEGVDVPNLEVLSMARPTESFPLFYQQFCRPLNPVEGKTAKIIDHVGNVHRHSSRWIDYVVNLKWTLDAAEKRGRGSAEKTVMVRTCTTCLAVYERAAGLICPYCGEGVIVASRTAPAHVDGDLHELDPEALAQLQGLIDAANSGPTFPYGATREIIGSIRKKHEARQDALEALKHSMAVWAAGKTDIPRAQREFYLTFGIDVATAQTLKRKEADELRERIEKHGV